MGSSKYQTVGYRYHLGIHFVLGVGPMDSLRGIRVGDRTLLQSAGYTTNQVISVNEPGLFGDEAREGGVAGDIELAFGGVSQAPSSYLQSVIGGVVPAFRGVMSVILRNVYIGTNPYLKPWAFLVQRVHAQHDGQPEWNPTKAQILDPDGVPDMNPAHIILECLTNRDWGLGQSRNDELNLDSFEAAADVFADEGFGLSFEMSAEGEVLDFIATVLDHCDASLQLDPATGRWNLNAIRDPGEASALELLDDSVIDELSSFGRPAYAELVNQVSVIYDDRSAGGIEKTMTVHNNAMIQLQGAVVAKTIRMPGLSYSEIASRVAARELRTESTPLARGEALVLGEHGMNLRVGQALRLTWPPLGIDELVVRVVDISYGTLTDGRVRVEFVEDVFASATALYSTPPPSGWQPPNHPPVPLTHRAVLEAPYWILARQVLGETPELDELVADEGGLVSAAARQPSGDSYNFQIVTRQGSAEYQQEGPGDFVASGFLPDDLPREAVSEFEIDLGRSLSEVAPDQLVLIGGVEWAKVLDSTGDLIELARGVLDTPPVPHEAGALLLFMDTGGGVAEPTYYLPDSVDVKLQPVTSLGQLPLDDAPTDQVVFQARALLPYAPGNMRLNTVRYPVFINDDLLVEWSHRDRVQQTAYLVEQTEGNIGPEDGTTYTVTIRGEADTIIEQQAGIAGTSFPLTLEDELLITGAGRPQDRLRVTIEAQRDGYDSWTVHETITARAGFGLKFGSYFGGNVQ